MRPARFVRHVKNMIFLLGNVDKRRSHGRRFVVPCPDARGACAESHVSVSGARIIFSREREMRRCASRRASGVSIPLDLTSSPDSRSQGERRAT